MLTPDPIGALRAARSATLVALVLAACASKDASHVQELSSASVCLGSPAIGGAEPPRSENDAPGALDDALARVGLDRGSLGLGAERTAMSKLAVDDPRMLESARAVLRRPLELRARGRDVARGFDEAIASDRPVTRAILAAAALREVPASGCVDPVWMDVPPGDSPLADAIAGATGSRNPPPELRSVPLELQRALVPVVRAAAWATAQVEAARSKSSGVPPQLLTAIGFVPEWLLGVKRFELSPALDDAFERVDTRRIATAAASLASVIEEVDLRRFAGLELAPVTLSTRIGTIALRGASNDVWDSPDAPALLVDTGGDDQYYGPVAASSLARPISVAIDLGGRDLYAYREIEVAADEGGGRLPSDGAGRAEGGRTLSTIGRQGSGVLGAGLLFDLGGEADRYRSLVASQGAGSHGVGVLFDDGGDDVYEAEGMSQGAAAWGIGLLIDRDGADRYTLFQAGQGFGFTRGTGALIDAAGADVYTADPGEPSLGGSLLYPSDQLPGPPASAIVANHSFAQGCGAGHRPDWPDPGWPFPGGLGVLRDAAGDDQYAAGVFAQGCGFVQGLGMLLDGGGDDAYDGLYYVEGTAAHLAAALFADDGGDDRFNGRFPVAGPALGLGHDLSVALHVNRDGRDAYASPAPAFGVGLANGIGVFIDDGGDDHFETRSKLSLGAAQTNDVRDERRSLPTIGVFVKANGSGSYTAGGKLLDHPSATWTSSAADPEVEIGVGVERPGSGAPR